MEMILLIVLILILAGGAWCTLRPGVWALSPIGLAVIIIILALLRVIPR
jgi:hypothetical protein